MLLIAGIAYVIYRAWTENWGGIQEKTAAVWAWLLQNAFHCWRGIHQRFVGEFAASDSIGHDAYQHAREGMAGGVQQGLL
jgi:hypothetical protein